MSLFKVTWINHGELDFSSSDFCEIVYDVSNHSILYETCNGIRHILRCDFGSIFDKLHSIVGLEDFQNEKLYKDGCDGSWYKFEYVIGGSSVEYEGYLYGLKFHEQAIALIELCAKSTLDDERKLLSNGYHLELVEDWVQDIVQKRQKLEDDFLAFWKDIDTISIRVPVDFVRCPSCGSVIHNKYYKNREYFGRFLVHGELGDYEVEYDSGECPVCGELNDELPCTGIYSQPDDSDGNKFFYKRG